MQCSIKEYTSGLQITKTRNKTRHTYEINIIHTNQLNRCIYILSLNNQEQLYFTYQVGTMGKSEYIRLATVCTNT